MPKDIVFDAKVTVEPGKPVEMPSGDFVANAEFTRDGHDLHLTSPEGKTIVIEGYFAQETQPDIVTADGAHLSPEMVDAFLPPQHAGQYAQAGAATVSDVSPAGQITELTGSATIVRADGTKVPAAVGTPVYPGDVVETSADGAVNILFADNTTFAISESARLSIDEFNYNAADQEGTSFFSMLQGMFVYTSGLIGKNDPGNVNIETPVGSIGIRGTVVAGDINPAGEESKITIVDGAIVLTNQAGTMELNDAFETASVTGYNDAPVNSGQMDANTFAASYQSVSTVAGTTFTSAGASAPAASSETAAPAAQQQEASPEAAPAPAPETEPAPDAQTQPATEGTDVKTEAPADSTEQPATGGTEALPPPPPPVFFMPPPPPPPPSGTEFGTTTTTTFIAPTDGTGGTTTTVKTDGTTTFMPPPPPPPPPGDTTLTTTTTTNNPPPPPFLNFQFSNTYLNGTPGNINDDGIRLFGTPWSPGMVIGQANLANFAGAVRYELVYRDGISAPVRLAGDGAILGDAYTYAGLGNPANITPGSGIFSFNAATGSIIMQDPWAMNQNINGPFNFTLEARDSAGTVVATHNFTFLMDNFTGDVYLGTATNDGNAAAFTGGITLTGGNRAALTADGDDFVLAGGAGNKIFLGNGNDAALVTDPGFGVVDGGAGVDRVVLGGGLMYDFTASPSTFRNVEQVLLGGGADASDIRLNLQDIFEMTNGGAFALTIRTQNGSAQTGNLYLDTDLMTVQSGTLDVSGGTVGTGTVTLQGMHNGQTLTLIIEQGGSTDGVVVNNI